MIMLAVLGIGAYLLFMRQAQAGTSSGYTAGRTYLQSPSVASGASSGLGGIITGLGSLFKTSNNSTGGSPTLDESLNTWTKIENANRADPLYQQGIKDYYGTSNTGDPYNSGYDTVASNPSPLVNWDSWFSGTGGMGD